SVQRVARKLERAVSENHKPTCAAKLANANQAAIKSGTASGLSPPVHMPATHIAASTHQPRRTHSTLPSHFARRMASFSNGLARRLSSVSRSRSPLMLVDARTATPIHSRQATAVPKTRIAEFIAGAASPSDEYDPAVQAARKTKSMNTSPAQRN